MKYEDLSDAQRKMLRQLRAAPEQKTGSIYNPYDPETIERELRILKEEGWKPGAIVVTKHAQWEFARPAEVVYVGRDRRKGTMHYDDQDRAIVKVRRVDNSGKSKVVSMIFQSTRTSTVIEDA